MRGETTRFFALKYESDSKKNTSSREGEKKKLLEG